MTTLATTAFALLLTFGGTASASRYSPPRTGLQLIDAPSTLNTILSYPCEYDSTKTCTGIEHSEALFGVPKYGSAITAYLYEVPTPADGSDPAETGCSSSANPLKADPDWASPFILLMNRGECHFTEKVRNAARAGAVGVIVADNVALSTEPLAYCSDFSPPMFNSNGQWVPCTTAKHGTDCKCGTDHSVQATLLTSAPKCEGNQAPEYQEVCLDKEVVQDGGPCWYCAKVDASGSAESFPVSCFQGKETENNCQRESLLPFMADDGDGGDITIPSFIISDYSGALLKEAISTQASLVEPKRLQIRMAWDLKTRDKVNYELWTSCEDSNGAEFKRDFMETALKLIDVADFTPRYYVYDGHALQCDGKYNCGTQCISNGLYCGPDPDSDLGKGVNGADVVMENLRQMCIWKVLNDGVMAGTTPRKDLMKWWCYVNDFGNTCFNQESAMESGETFKKCADDIMLKHGLDAIPIEKCVSSSFVKENGPNVLLKQEISDAKDYGVLKLPEAVVNGVVLRGQTEYGATLELNVATAICNGFTQRPKECDDIITPEGTLGQSGNAKVTFTATLGYVDSLGGKLTESSLSETILNRFRSTLSLKLGVDPQIIQIGKPDQVTSGPDQVVVKVSVNNLKCASIGEDSSRSESVVSKLKGISTCESEASTDEEVESEVSDLEGEIFYFHTSSSHGSTNRQVQSVITKMMSDESLCLEKKISDGSVGGVPWWGVMLMAFFCSAVVFGSAFLYWRKKHKEQMRSDVKAILAEYMPLDDMGGNDESDEARMLEGGTI